MSARPTTPSPLRRVIATALVWSTLCSLVLIGVDCAPSVATTRPVTGASCRPLHATSVFRGLKFTCMRKGHRLEWGKGVPVRKTTTSSTTTTTTASTVGWRVAAGCASSYQFPDLSSVEGAGSGYAKPSVQAACSNGYLSVTSNGMIAYAFTHKTPNPLTAQSWKWKVTTNPVIASSPTSLVNVMGAIGFTVTGLAIYGPEEGAQPANQAYGDPVANKIVDACGGHTGPAGEYHDHSIQATSACHLNATVVGYAFDGFPIYSNPANAYTSGYHLSGDPSTNSWSAYTYSAGGPGTLDRCNGTTVDGRYRYYITPTFPYILGCYAGTGAAQTGQGPAAHSRSVFSTANSLMDNAHFARSTDCG